MQETTLDQEEQPEGTTPEEEEHRTPQDVAPEEASSTSHSRHPSTEPPHQDDAGTPVTPVGPPRSASLPISHARAEPVPARGHLANAGPIVGARHRASNLHLLSEAASLLEGPSHGVGNASNPSLPSIVVTEPGATPPPSTPTREAGPVVQPRTPRTSSKRRASPSVDEDNNEAYDAEHGGELADDEGTALPLVYKVRSLTYC